MPAEQALRCLAVTGDAALAAALGDALAATPGLELAPAVEPSALLAGRAPACGVLIVSHEPGQDAAALVRELALGGPRPPAVIVAAAPDLDLYRDAIAAGARGVVALPASPGALAAALVEAARTPPPPLAAKEGRAVAVAAATGGAGATTLALAIAALRRGLLVDLSDGYGDLAGLLGCAAERSVADLAAVGRALGGAAVASVAASHPGGLRLVAGAGDPALLAAFAPGAGAALVRDARAGSALVVVDVGVPALAVAWDAAVACDRLLLVVTPDVYSARAARSVVTAACRRGLADGVAALVLNRFSRRAELSRRGVERAVGAPVVALLREDRRAPAALANGRLELERWPPRSLRRALAGLAGDLA